MRGKIAKAIRKTCAEAPIPDVEYNITQKSQTDFVTGKSYIMYIFTLGKCKRKLIKETKKTYKLSKINN